MPQLKLLHLFVLVMLCALIILIVNMQFQLLQVRTENQVLQGLMDWQKSQVSIVYPQPDSTKRFVIGQQILLNVSVVLDANFTGSRPPALRATLINPATSQIETEVSRTATIGQGSTRLARYGLDIPLSTRPDLEPGFYLLTVTLLGADNTEVANTNMVINYVVNPN